MKIVAAYLLAVLGGNASPSAGDLKSILGSVGAEADEERLEMFLKEVEGKDLAELIASGREKMASVPVGGGGGVVGVAAPVARAGAEEVVEKKEKKVEEKEESEDENMFGLFDE